MRVTQCVFHFGRLVLLVSVIAQAVIFSAHIVNVQGDSRYYATALVVLPMLSISWWYFAKPPTENTNRPKFVWLAYASTVVAFQGLVFGATGVEEHDSFLLHTANVFTPILFLVCIVCGCEHSLRDAGFVVASGVTIFNAFDASEAYLVVAQNGKNVPPDFGGGFIAVASVMLIWSALEFTVRSRLEQAQTTPPVSVTCGLHAVHLLLNVLLFSLRTIFYINGWAEFSVMIAKNAMVFAIRLVYMLAVYGYRLRSPPNSTAFVIPTAPPSLIEGVDSNERLQHPPTPMSQRVTSQAQSPPHQDQDERHLYPKLPKRVHFQD